MCFSQCFNRLEGGGDNRTELGFAHVTNETWAYSGVFGFFRKKFLQKKALPPHPKPFFKICLDFFLNINYKALYQKTAFGFDPDLRKCLNQKTCKYQYLCARNNAYFMCFLVRKLPKVRDQIGKHFSDKVLYNYCSKYFLVHFGQYLKKK